MASPRRQQSDISCHTCRKRKVKWCVSRETATNLQDKTDRHSDRKYPHCLVCEQTMQTCTYPAGPLRPGPKVGSLRQRKRSRVTVDDGMTATPYLDTHNDSSAPDVGGNSILLATASGQNVPSTAEAKALDLAFILHPSHAASQPNNEASGPEKASSGDAHTQGTMQRACRVLGVESDEAEQL